MYNVYEYEKRIFDSTKSAASEAQQKKAMDITRSK